MTITKWIWRVKTGLEHRWYLSGPTTILTKLRVFRQRKDKRRHKITVDCLSQALSKWSRERLISAKKRLPRNQFAQMSRKVTKVRTKITPAKTRSLSFKRTHQKSANKVEFLLRLLQAQTSPINQLVGTCTSYRCLMSATEIYVAKMRQTLGRNFQV